MKVQQKQVYFPLWRTEAFVSCLLSLESTNWPKGVNLFLSDKKKRTRCSSPQQLTVIILQKSPQNQSDTRFLTPDPK